MPFFDFFRKKHKPNLCATDRADLKADTRTRHCFVLCGTAKPGDLSNAGRAVSELFGHGYTAELSDANIITITHGDETIGFLAHMPIPIPGGEAEENADGNFLWPSGKDEAAKHRSHVMVTTMGASDQTQIQSAIAVSRLALVALKVFDGIGVYWAMPVFPIRAHVSKTSAKACPKSTCPYPYCSDFSWYARRRMNSACTHSA